MKEDFLVDIEKGELFLGEVDGDVAVVVTLNQECDAEYQRGNWKYPNSKYRIIHRLCVHPNYQNRGIAKQMLRYIETELYDGDVETLRLDVFCQNPFALALYQNDGYEKVGMVEWRKGAFFLMEKHL